MKCNYKLILLLFCLLLPYSLTACQQSSKETKGSKVTVVNTETPANTDKPEDTAENTTQPPADTHQIGICQINSDPCADAMTKGFQDGINANKKDMQVSFLIKNAPGDASTFAEQCKEYDQTGLDLMFIENTDQSLPADTTGYQTPTLVLPEIDITERVEETLLQLLPDIQQLGILYDSSDPAMVAKVNQMTQYLDKDQIPYQKYPASDASSFCDSANDICDQCDATYIPANTLALSQVSQLENIFLPAGIPLITDNTELGNIGFAAVALQSYELGYQYGKTAAEILQKGTMPNRQSVDPSPYIQKYYNPQICEDFVIDVPTGLTALPDTK